MVGAITGKVLRCYVDTSVFNFALDESRGEKYESAKDFLKACRDGKFEAYISPLVIEEIARTGDVEKRKRLLEVVNNVEPVKLPPFNEKVTRVMEEYLKVGIVPQKAKDDAAHMATATVNDLDVIVSWNMEHMVKLKTRIQVNAVNKLLGYKEIEIATPQEVVSDEEG